MAWNVEPIPPGTIWATPGLLWDNLTININSVTAHAREEMLAEFMTQNYFELIFVQEVMSPGY
jgi:hypothetical protein